MFAKIKTLIFLAFIFSGIPSLSADLRTKTEKIFKDANLPFDIQFAQSNPFGTAPILSLAQACKTKICKRLSHVLKDAEENFEKDPKLAIGMIRAVSLEFNSFFATFLAHFYDLYNREKKIHNLVEISVLFTQEFEESATNALKNEKEKKQNTELSKKISQYL